MIRRAAFLNNGLRSQPGLGSLLSRAKHLALALAVTCLGTPALAHDAPPGRHEIVFVESNVAKYRTLLDGVKPGAEVHLLDATQDGLGQIAEILKGRNGIDAIHLVSHGSEGAVQLGALNLTAQNLNGHVTDLATIGRALKPGGDLLLYGCDVAKGSDGTALVDALAQATQADIAASTDVTGAASLGGDWQLEYAAGAIETAALDGSGYDGMLVSATFMFDSGLPTVYPSTTNTVTQTFGSETIELTSVGDGWISMQAAGMGSISGTDSLASDGVAGMTSVTVRLQSGNQFDLTSFKELELGGVAGTLTLTSSKGSLTYLVGSGSTPNTHDVSAHVNAAAFQGITSFTMTYSSSPWMSGFDDIVLMNITAPGPTVTDARIGISGATGTGGIYKIGDTVTATWNNTAGGDNNSGITGVTVDVSQFGGGAAVAATNSAGTWTATYTIAAGAIDGTNRNVSVTATNGTPTTTADTTNATVDNIAPTVTDARIGINGATGTGGAYRIGDTITATWNNTAGGDSNADTIGSVNVDFSAFGGGAAVAATNSGGTWTATYTITAGAIDSTNRNVSVTATDNAGNATTSADTSNATLDNVAPTVTDARISISGGSGAGGAFRDGDTVTATWNNTAGGDNNADTISSVTVNFSAFGGGAAVAATNSAGTWTATYGITPASTSGSNKNVSVTATDNAGNTITAADTSNATVDNVVPGAPTGVSASAGDTQASVTFTAPASSGSSAITTYTATSNPGGLTGSCAGPAACAITVTGLTNGTAYTFTVTATNGAGTGSASAASNSVTPKAAQTITFPNPGAQNFGTTPTLSASASSGLTPTFTSSTTGVCTITSGGALTFVTAGTCTINADQAGNGTYAAAPTVTQSFTVNAVAPGAPTIGTATAGDTQASVTFSAPASNGGSAITGYTATSNPGGITGTCAASPCTVTGLTNGTAYTFTVTATNSAGTSLASAASNSVTPKAAQTITFANPGAQNFGTTPTLSATSTSGLTVSFTSSTTGVCTITSGGALTFVTTGTCTINADQAGNGSFLAASTVSRSFSVNAVAPGAPTIGTASAGDIQATVSFSAPAFTGGASITGYTVTSNPGGVTGTGASSPITVTGLTNGVAYTFTVTATNSAGTSSASAASNAVTPNPGPAVVSVAVPANGTYRTGQNLDFTVTWDQNTTVTGTPRIALVIGAATVQANYVSSPTATTSLFRYTVLAGQTDSDGITVGALTLNGGTIRNASNTDATLTLNSVGSTAAVLVDTTAPTLPAANIVVNNQADPHKVVLTFSENLNNATLGAANTWTVTANGGSPSYTVASVALAAGNQVTLTLAAVDVTSAATTITNAAANAHLKVTPPATLADVAGNTYAAGLVTEAGATHVLDTTAPTLAGVATSSPTTSGGTLAATASEKALGYWIAVASGAAAPTVGQVKAGVNYGAVTVAAHGSGALPAVSAGSLSLTGLAASTSYDIYLVAEDAAGNPSAAVSTATLTTSAAPASGGSTGPIPPLGTQPGLPGIGSQPPVLDLSGGNGPAMTNCLLDTLRQNLGGTPVYLGQTAGGVVKVGWNGQVLSFYPLDATATNSQGEGIHLHSANPLSVVTSCGTFNTVPALSNLGEFGAILNGMGLSAQINAQGVITVLVNGSYYVVRPDYLVTPGTPGAPSLVMGEDGLFRFTDSAGNSQVLHPAFLDPDALQGQLYLLGGSIAVQTDGTALLVYGGQQYILVPDLTLGGVPPEFASVYWWQDGPFHYRFRNAVSTFVNTSQGFTVRSVP